jgi:hypothetical protein
MRWQPVLTGVLGLALLEAALSSDAASGRVGQLLEGVAGLVSHVLSPTVPAIPDLRKSAAGAWEDAGGIAGDLAGEGLKKLKPSSGSGQSSGSKTYPADWSTSASALFV